MYSTILMSIFGVGVALSSPSLPTTNQAPQASQQPQATNAIPQVLKDWAVEISLAIAATGLVAFQRNQGQKTREALAEFMSPFKINFKHDFDIQMSLHQVLGATNADRAALGIFRNGDIGSGGYHFQKISFDAEATHNGFSAVHLGDTWPISTLIPLGSDLNTEHPWILPKNEAGKRYLAANRIMDAWFYPVLNNTQVIGLIVLQFASEPKGTPQDPLLLSALQSVQEAIQNKIQK